MAEAKPTSGSAPSLDEVRQRIDAIDAELLRLLEERAGLASVVKAAKAAAGDDGRFGLRPGRETVLLRKLLSAPRGSATPSLVVRIWRELIGASLAVQGPFHIAVWGGRDPARVTELTRHRFGAAPPLSAAAKAEDAIAAAKTPPRRAEAEGVRRSTLPRRLGAALGAGCRGSGGRAHRRRSHLLGDRCDPVIRFDRGSVEPRWRRRDAAR